MTVRALLRYPQIMAFHESGIWFSRILVCEQKLRNKNIAELFQTIITMMKSSTSAPFQSKERVNSYYIENVVKLAKQLNDLLKINDISDLTGESNRFNDAILLKYQN